MKGEKEGYGLHNLKKEAMKAQKKHVLYGEEEGDGRKRPFTRELAKHKFASKMPLNVYGLELEPKGKKVKITLKKKKGSGPYAVRGRGDGPYAVRGRGDGPYAVRGRGNGPNQVGVRSYRGGDLVEELIKQGIKYLPEVYNNIKSTGVKGTLNKYLDDAEKVLRAKLSRKSIGKYPSILKKLGSELIMSGLGLPKQLTDHRAVFARIHPKLLAKFAGRGDDYIKMQKKPSGLVSKVKEFIGDNILKFGTKLFGNLFKKKGGKLEDYYEHKYYKPNPSAVVKSLLEKIKGANNSAEAIDALYDDIVKEVFKTMGITLPSYILDGMVRIISKAARQGLDDPMKIIERIYQLVKHMRVTDAASLEEKDCDLQDFIRGFTYGWNNVIGLAKRAKPLVSKVPGIGTELAGFIDGIPMIPGDDLSLDDIARLGNECRAQNKQITKAKTQKTYDEAKQKLDPATRKALESINIPIVGNINKLVEGSGRKVKRGGNIQKIPSFPMQTGEYDYNLMKKNKYYK
jgi:hypothetical protein